MFEVKNISKVFEVEKQKIIAIDNISFDAKKGEFVTIIGPSGCGKSTLSRIIAGLEPQTSGQIIWKEKPKIGFVFQNYAIFPFLTVFENIEFGLKMNGVKKEDIKKIVTDLIKEVGLIGFEDKHPKELSGGMKQRVGIARSLAINPNILILDEPFSSLDEFTAENLRQELLKIWKSRKITIFLVTHLIEEALSLSDRIIVMAKSPGTIINIFKNDLARPRDLRSQEFFKFEDKLSEILH